MESIEFQNTAFFRELTLAFTELQKVKADKMGDSEEVHVIAAVIKHHTGFTNIVFNVDTDIGPAVDIPAVNKNNPLINSFIRGYLSSADGVKMINDANGMVRGSVNIRTGKVSGIFADIKSTIYFPASYIEDKKYLPEELASTTLHEVGHLFTYYEFMSRSVTTNQVLAGMSKALDGSTGPENREAILISVKKSLNLKDLDTKKLAASNNNKVAEIVVVTNVVKSIESEIGTNIYDFSTWEYLADQYAARQGAGRHLVTALEKIYKGYWNISFRSTPGYLAMEAFKLIMIFGGLITLTASAFTIGMLFLAMDGSGDGTYDRPGARMKRVRNQIVENLKDKKLTKDDHERLTADLVTIDDVLKEANDRRQFLGLIWDNISMSARKARSQEQLQQELESIAANDLFVKAAELRSLA